MGGKGEAIERRREIIKKMMKTAKKMTCGARRSARSVGKVRRVGAAASIRETSSLTREVAATTPSEKEEAVVVGAAAKPAAVSGVALAVAGALATAPAALAIAEMPSPAGTMGGALPALATILFVFLPTAFLIVLFVNTDEGLE